ncbi:MAG: hypothetical protein KTR26_09110 [Flammeovirgaceae bacterium]|nr:hypothetical protein [Flammeovirgaceae bacterium]
MKTTFTLTLILISLSLFGQKPSAKTPEDIFGHLIGTDIQDHPNFKKEFSYGYVELGMVEIGEAEELFGVKLESQVGYAFYKGKLCSISFEYKNADAFQTLEETFGKPRYAHTENEALGEMYSFVWEGKDIAISYPVFKYGSKGSQFITVEDISFAKR